MHPDQLKVWLGMMLGRQEVANTQELAALSLFTGTDMGVRRGDAFSSGYWETMSGRLGSEVFLRVGRGEQHGLQFGAASLWMAASFLVTTHELDANALHGEGRDPERVDRVELGLRQYAEMGVLLVELAELTEAIAAWTAPIVASRRRGLALIGRVRRLDVGYPRLYTYSQSFPTLAGTLAGILHPADRKSGESIRRNMETPTRDNGAHGLWDSAVWSRGLWILRAERNTYVPRRLMAICGETAHADTSGDRGVNDDDEVEVRDRDARFRGPQVNALVSAEQPGLR